MIRLLLALAALPLLQGCTRAAAPQGAPAPSGIGISTAKLSFLYSYPAEAAAIPELAALLHKDGTERLAEAQRDAAARRRPRSGPDKVEQSWEVTADTRDLLALISIASTYQDGSAHGYYAFRTLIWHRPASRKVRLDELFSDRRTGSAELMAELCDELRGVRAARRRPEPMPCPRADTAAVVPVAGRTNRIKSFRMLLTGDETPEGYAGGSLEIEIPVSPTVAARIDPALRGSF